MKAFDREALGHLAFNIRRDIVATIATNGEGHVGGACLPRTSSPCSTAPL